MKTELQTVIDQEIIRSYGMDLDRVRLDLSGNIWIIDSEAQWQNEEMIEKCHWRPYAMYDKENDKMLIDIELMPTERFKFINMEK